MVSEAKWKNILVSLEMCIHLYLPYLGHLMLYLIYSGEQRGPLGPPVIRNNTTCKGKEEGLHITFVNAVDLANKIKIKSSELGFSN